MVGQLVPTSHPASLPWLNHSAPSWRKQSVITFELTGEVNFITPFVISILTAKWVADAISADGVCDLAQHLQDHLFFKAESATKMVRQFRDERGSAKVDVLIPSKDVVENAIVSIGSTYRVTTSTLQTKLPHLRNQGLSNSGLVFIHEGGISHGYISKYKLENALHLIEKTYGIEGSYEIHVLKGAPAEGIDRSPLTVPSEAPLKYAAELFGKLGIRRLVVNQEDTAKGLGVISKT